MTISSPNLVRGGGSAKTLFPIFFCPGVPGAPGVLGCILGRVLEALGSPKAHFYPISDRSESDLSLICCSLALSSFIFLASVLGR